MSLDVYIYDDGDGQMISMLVQPARILAVQKLVPQPVVYEVLWISAHVRGDTPPQISPVLKCWWGS